ncbi:MAG: serine/threonine protein kinase [Myxococcales bacterium]|nr:serine/threonine protein kinase [Myxococcales bacterium]
MSQIHPNSEEILLDDLRLVRRIAAGGMAEVWEARQGGVQGFEKRLAVKVVLPHLVENQEFIHMFLDEGRLAARLDHPNVCQIYKLGHAQSVNTYYMAMEYIDGVGLNSIMRESARRGLPLPFEHCCQIMIGACAGLDYAHSCTDSNGQPLYLVHRDISPQNLMITFDGAVKVVDFGIAKAATQLQHTRAGVVKGKYAYMSPEQATGDSLDLRSDVFALGVVLWEMTTGHRLFRADNEIATLHKIISGDYPPPSAYRDSYPPALEMIVMRALAPNRDERYQNCGQLQMDLEDFLLRHGMAAGSKRLAHYVRWLMSGDDLPLPTGSSISQAFDIGEGSLSTPHPNRSPMTPYPPSATPLPSQSGVRSMYSAASGMMQTGTGARPLTPQAQMPHPMHQSIPDEPSIRRKRRRGGGLWLFLLLLLLGGGGYVYYAFFMDLTPSVDTAPMYWLVQSQPRNAQIFVNGASQGQTPKVIVFPQNKRLILKVALNGYEPYVQQFNVVTEEKVRKPLQIKLIRETAEAVFGDLVINLQTPKARVILDGERLKPIVAGSPIFMKRIRAERPHALVIEADGHESLFQSFQITKGQRKEFQVLLKQRKEARVRKRPRRRFWRRRRPAPVRERLPDPGLPDLGEPTRRQAAKDFAWISVQSEPDGASVLVDGQSIGTTPLSRTKIAPGKHRLILRKTGYQTLRRGFSVSADELKPLSFDLSPQAARAKVKLQLGASPKSKVYLDGSYIGMTPIYNHEVEPGAHQIEFRTSRFAASHKMKVDVNPSKRRLFHRFQTGQLWVLTRPPAVVFLNNTKLGRSNRPPYSVPAGTYVLRLVTDEGQSVIERGVVVRAGKKTTFRKKISP